VYGMGRNGAEALCRTSSQTGQAGSGGRGRRRFRRCTTAVLTTTGWTGRLVEARWSGAACTTVSEPGGGFEPRTKKPAVLNREAGWMSPVSHRETWCYGHVLDARLRIAAGRHALGGADRCRFAIAFSLHQVAFR
jgi:heme A synthase